MKKIAANFALLLALAISPAAAQEAEHIDNFGDWSAFTATEGGAKFCYMASAPKKAEGKYTKRGDVYAMVTHRPAENLLDEVNVRAGYTYMKGSEVTVTIGGASFKMFTDGGRAWTFEKKDDKAIVLAMKRGSTMVIRGTSSRGTLTTDTYSLTGFTKAYNTISQACGVK